MLSFAFLIASIMSRSSEGRLLWDSYDCLLTPCTQVLSGDTKLLLTTLVPETTAALEGLTEVLVRLAISFGFRADLAGSSFGFRSLINIYSGS